MILERECRGRQQCRFRIGQAFKLQRRALARPQDTRATAADLLGASRTSVELDQAGVGRHLTGERPLVELLGVVDGCFVVLRRQVLQYARTVRDEVVEQIRCGNLGTPCLLIPNRPTMLGTWGSFVGGDCHFLETSKWKAEDYVWRPEVIALLGHN